MHSADLNGIDFRLPINDDAPGWSWAHQQRRFAVSAADVYSLLAQAVPDAADVPLPGLQRICFDEGQRIFEVGQQFYGVAIVRLGFFKTFTLSHDGTEQVVSFPMRASILGVDGIDSGRHQSCAQALSSGELIFIPYSRLLVLGRSHPHLHACVFKAISAELESNLAMIRLLATRHAEARIARFLVWLGRRHASLGYSDTEYYLRMRRCDIGSYLGVTLETVCRTLTTLHNMGMIEITRRHMRILDQASLATVDRLPATPARLKQIEANRLRRRKLRQARESSLH